MSHNVTMKTLSIVDFKVLAQALKELNSEYGTNLRFEEGAQVAGRNYGKTNVLPNTVGVIHTGETARYDITLTKHPEGNFMQTEAMNIDTLKSAFGVGAGVQNLVTGETVNVGATGYRRNEELGMSAALGRITQRYGVILAEHEAVMQGKSTTRHFNAQTGVMNVEVTI